MVCVGVVSKHDDIFIIYFILATILIIKFRYIKSSTDLSLFVPFEFQLRINVPLNRSENTLPAY